MKEILTNLRTRLQQSTILDYIKDNSIIVDDTELRIQKISVKDFPAIILSRGGENTAQSDHDLVLWRKGIEIVVAQDYDKIDTVILGDHTVKGITEITDDILSAICEEPTLQNATKGFDPSTIRIEEGFLSEFSAYVAARRMFIDFFKIKQIQSE
jgi:hypothetical protein